MAKTTCLRVSLQLAALLMLSALTACSSEMYEIPEEDLPPTSLPTMRLLTPEGSPIDRSLMENIGMVVSDATGRTIYTNTVMAKGRGNTSWIRPKKPYTLLIPNEDTLLNLPPGNNRVLLANYDDLSLIRNDLAFFMGQLRGRSDIPHSCFIDLVTNGLYTGIYQLCESVEDICLHEGSDVLVEVDGKARYHEPIFHTTQLQHPFSIHYPEVEEGDATYNFIAAFVQKAEDILFSEHFADAEGGYREFFDMDSFVEWYLINEIAKNNDAILYTSCFIHFAWNGQLKMGPIWDFDIAFGNYPYKRKKVVNNPKNFYLRNVSWFARLFDDPDFKSRVKDGLAFYYTHRQELYEHIDATSRLLIDRVPLDNRLWGCLCDKTASEERVKDAYTKQAEELKEWLEQRLEWLYSHRDEL